MNQHEEWTESDRCKNRKHCWPCRNDQAWRDNLKEHYQVPEDFDTVCPFGVTKELVPDRGFGDRVTRLIARITKRLGIKHCASCKERAERLNKQFPYRDKE